MPITVQLAVHDCRGRTATLMLLLIPFSVFAVMRPAATDGNKLLLGTDISGRNSNLCLRLMSKTQTAAVRMHVSHVHFEDH